MKVLEKGSLAGGAPGSLVGIPHAPAPPAPPMAAIPLKEMKGIPDGQGEQRIGQLLSRHAARMGYAIEQLRVRLAQESLTERQREVISEKIEEMEKERLGVLAAAQALKSEAVQQFLGDVVPVDEILKEVEAELKRQNINIEGLEQLLDQQ